MLKLAEFWAIVFLLLQLLIPGMFKAQLAKHSGLDIRWVAFFPLMALLASLGFSGWSVYTLLPLTNAVGRFVDGTFAMAGFALVFSPVLLPSAVAGWIVAWQATRPFRAHGAVRAGMCGALAGLGAIVPVAVVFRYGTESEWSLLVYPLICVSPVSGIIAAALVYRNSRAQARGG